MDQIIIRSTLLCVLIFGLCEAHWKIQDNWPKNARPLSKDEIELTAEAKMSVIKNDTRDSIQSIQEEIKACQEGIVVQAEKESDEIRNERFETQEKLQNSEYDSMMYDDNDSLERYYAREELSKICSHQNGMIQKLEAKLQVLKDEEKRKIDNIQYQMQQYLSDSEQGFTRRSRVEIDMPNVSFDLTVPYGKTVIYLGNTIKKPQRSDAIKFCVETDPETLFPFELDYTGPLYGINGNATHLHAEILSADGLKIFNYGIGLQNFHFTNCYVYTGKKLDRPASSVWVTADRSNTQSCYFRLLRISPSKVGEQALQYFGSVIHDNFRQLVSSIFFQCTMS